MGDTVNRSKGQGVFIGRRSRSSGLQGQVRITRRAVGAGTVQNGGTSWVYPNTAQPLVAIADTGATFKGWYKISNGQSVKITSNSTYVASITQNTIFEAKFQKNHAYPQLTVTAQNYNPTITNFTTYSFQQYLTCTIAQAGNPDVYSYQWYCGDQNSTSSMLQCENGSQYRIQINTTGGQKYYVCKVTQIFGGQVKSKFSSIIKITTSQKPVMSQSYPADVSSHEMGKKLTISIPGCLGNPYPQISNIQWHIITKGVDTTQTKTYNKTTNSVSFTPNKAQYSVYAKMTNTAGSCQTRRATIICYDATSPVKSDTYPKDVVMAVNTTTTLTIQQTGQSTIKSYQWQSNQNNTWTDISGANSKIYNLNSTSGGLIKYRCKVTNVYDTVGYSRIASVTTVSNPSVKTQPVAGNCTAGTPTISSGSVTWVTGSQGTAGKNYTISCQGTGGYPTNYLYQWYKNNSAISGATSSSYSATPSASGGSDSYFCRITCKSGNVSLYKDTNSVSVSTTPSAWTLRITATTDLVFSSLPYTKVKVYTIGGGGGGGAASRYSGAGGGGSGYIVSTQNNLATGTTYSATIGSGGAGATKTNSWSSSGTQTYTYGSDGGTTKFVGGKFTSSNTSASGGKGGRSGLAHNGWSQAGAGGEGYKAGGKAARINGVNTSGESGAAVAGKAGVSLFGGYVSAGGCGGGSCYSSSTDSTYTKGATNTTGGGAGGNVLRAGSAATTYGSGGGGAGASSSLDTTYKGGAGAKGVIYIQAIS